MVYDVMPAAGALPPLELPALLTPGGGELGLVIFETFPRV